MKAKIIIGIAGAALTAAAACAVKIISMRSKAK